jgi:hypothetical protein
MIEFNFTDIDDESDEEDEYFNEYINKKLKFNRNDRERDISKITSFITSTPIHLFGSSVGSLSKLDKNKQILSPLNEIQSSTINLIQNYELIDSKKQPLVVLTPLKTKKIILQEQDLKTTVQSPKKVSFKDPLKDIVFKQSNNPSNERELTPVKKLPKITEVVSHHRPNISPQLKLKLADPLKQILSLPIISNEINIYPATSCVNENESLMSINLHSTSKRSITREKKPDPFKDLMIKVAANNDKPKAKSIPIDPNLVRVRGHDLLKKLFENNSK